MKKNIVEVGSRKGEVGRFFKSEVGRAKSVSKSEVGRAKSEGFLSRRGEVGFQVGSRKLPVMALYASFLQSGIQ